MKRFTTLILILSAVAATGAWAQDPHQPLTLSSTPVLPASVADSISFASKVANGNLVGVTISNYGFIGNNFISRDPSFEYPLGSGYEHMVRGGLWVGGVAIDDNGPFTGVVTGTVDGSQGSSTQSATEWTPAGRTILGRSSLQNSEFFNRDAISELDLLSDFSDRPAKRSDNNGESHRPMGLLVHQENYAWSFSEFAHSLFFHFQVINNGPPLQNVWIGIYSEMISVCKKCQTQWPAPGIFNKKWIACDDTLTMKTADSLKSIPPLFREHFCQALPIPNGCKLETVPYWAGIKALGWKRSRSDTAVNKKVTLAAWRYSPGSQFRNEDVERYEIMSRGFIQPLNGDSLQPGSGDPVEVLAIGPFSQIDPGDTVSADFAFVGGAEIPDIQAHSRFAQRAFDRNYIVPVPPPSPRLHAVARHNAIDLYWDDSPDTSTDVTSPLPHDFEGYRVYISEDRLDLHRVAQFDLASPSPHDTTGFNTGFGAITMAHDTTFAGDPIHYKYRYTIDHLRDGFKYFVSVTSFDLGNVEIESLESGTLQNKTMAVPAPGPGEQVGGDKITVFPNPYRVEARWDAGQKVRNHYLWFANLPERGTLKIFTLSGDLVYETALDGATYHGANARGIYNPPSELDIEAPTMSGRVFGWDMITKGGQAAATGLYMYSVEGAGGEKHRGKFLIVKSDREDF